MVQNTIPTRSQLIPLLTKWQDIGKKSQLGPVIVTILFFFLMNIFGSESVITIPITGLKPGTVMDPRLWVLIAAFAFTAYFLWLFEVEHDFGWLYDFFHGSLAGGEPDDSMPFLQLFMRHFLGTGFFEETVKAIPLLALMIAGSYMGPALRARFGIDEPLDGILIGAASGGGFALMETLAQYVPQDMVHTWIRTALLLFTKVDAANVAQVMHSLTPSQAYDLINVGKGVLGTAPGTQGLIIRSLDLGFGHMAYSGYFGYFIGLAVIKPEQRWKILGIGLVSASIPHALWDSIMSLDSTPLTAGVAVLSYAVLAAAVLKAREISPNRALLQPSVVFGPANPAPIMAVNPSGVVAGAAYAAPQPRQPIGQPAPVTPVNPLPTGTSSLRIGTKYLVIVAGLRLLAHQVPGLQSNSDEGLVAEVTRNPNDPSVLGLTNLSTTAWDVATTNSRREIQPGQTVKLSPGTRIDFGSTDGEVS